MKFSSQTIHRPQATTYYYKTIGIRIVQLKCYHYLLINVNIIVSTTQIGNANNTGITTTGITSIISITNEIFLKHHVVHVLYELKIKYDIFTLRHKYDETKTSDNQ